jgi:hypothetical protein
MPVKKRLQPNPMIRLEDIHPGLLLRVIAPHGLGAPLYTIATVESVDTSASGDWFCIVRYHNKRSTKHGTRLYLSHLWESDLGRFEIVTDQKEDRGVSRPTRSRRNDQTRP